MSVASFDRVRSGDTSDPLSKLREMVEQRPVLAPGFAAAMTRRDASIGDDWSGWARAVITLANVNAGPGALLAAFSMAAAPRGRSTQSIERVAASLHQAAHICRKAGGPATRICLETYRTLSLGPLLADASEAAWWRGMIKIADAASACIALTASMSDRILRDCGPLGFEQFIDAALRASSDKARRAAFLSLQDPESRRVLDRLSGRDTFTTLQPRLQAYATALWGQTLSLRAIPPSPDSGAARRATFVPGLVFIPNVSDASATRTASLYDAIVAHATAHLVFGGPRFEPLTLKPIQIALVGLIEDARVEALAIRRFPGLLRLWSSFHHVEKTHLKTAPLIMARLARALLDRTIEDNDGIVVKGRALFDAEPDLSDPGLSRRLGDVLGNDIGQMRIGFDAKIYVVEPIYRDDNQGLWTPVHPPDAESQPLEAPIETARPEHEEQDGEGCDPDPGSSTARLRLVAPDDRGIPIAHYPEWDRAAGLERSDWTTVRADLPPTVSSSAFDETLRRYAGLSSRVARLVRAARFGRPKRLRRQADGPELDLDAAIDAMADLRIGTMPDGLIHQRKVLASRDIAVSILIDMSESTSDHVPAAGMTILAIEQLAVAVLAAAMGALGDTFALRAFASEGRENIHLIAIKDFSAPFDQGARARLAGLRPALSTRLGAALRHAGAELAEIGATRRIVIAMTDGAPSDIDVDDPDDLIEDARRATLKLRAQGIDVFGIVLAPTGRSAGASIFGRTDHMPVRRIEELPSRLASLYFRIAQR